jgi:hypothetical protein
MQTVKASGLKRRRRTDSDAVQQQPPLPLHHNRATAVPPVAARQSPTSILSVSFTAPRPLHSFPLRSSASPSPPLFHSAELSFLYTPPSSRPASLFNDSLAVPGAQSVIAEEESLQSSASLALSMLATTPSLSPLPDSSTPPPATVPPPVPAPAASSAGPALSAQPTAGYSLAEVIERCRASNYEQYLRMRPMGFVRMTRTWGKVDAALRGQERGRVVGSCIGRGV